MKQQLESLVQHAMRGHLDIPRLAERAYQLGNKACHAATGEAMRELLGDMPLTFADYEKLAVQRALVMTKGDRIAAAKMLGIGKTTLYRKVREYGLDGDHVCPNCGTKVHCRGGGER